MYTIAHWSLILALLLSTAGAGFACVQAWSGQDRSAPWLERAHLVSVLLMVLASSMLLQALVGHDFSLAYVAKFTDRSLPLVYTVAAFWAGQEGSLLFWALCMGLAVAAFLYSRTYQELAPGTRQHFWLFYLPVQAFFLLLITGMSNPFAQSAAVPPDGQGLNPLLRNIGMALHPPLLFAGYALFTIPACLALASAFSGERKPWVEAARNWLLPGWSLLTAGILLGGWWAYMELGWGGYWAWDPVENASLIPWFAATALVHTALLERRFGVLPRTNVFLACLTLLLCIFATYLVRSGVVESLHAFGSGTVGRPLLLSLVFGLALSLAVITAMPRGSTPALAELGSRQGAMALSVWLLVALGAVVLLGTVWPVISQLWESKPVGLTKGFYNSVCLPLFTLLALLLAVTPWFGWRGGVERPRLAVIPVLVWLAAVGAGLWLGVRPLLAAAGVGAAAAVGATVLIQACLAPKLLRTRGFWASHGSHLAFACIVMGVAVSGPFQKTLEVPLSPGETVSFEGYEFRFDSVREITTPEMTAKEAVVEVTRDGKHLGELTPQQRLYRNYDHPNSEVSILFSLGNELYATIHDLDGDRVEPLKISINPMVNWVWIGSLAICLLPLLALRRRAENSHAVKNEDEHDDRD
ncbi:MAG TPA: cytochrome c-type biogenesis CcmF C-terminal domain-containing protein [Humidesulfovibrio sp.]|uniref:heme lyase CcmF/NrfE family subunit n=1 Tax=Humidesulfovibrio sp. TaxID=2910988 RepID=UPI002C5DF311|nr:cytochrome c-type biogenesis CcmF C-terminal domain-containing protein [Humidesulfovibrio sp.]HWR05143.1 cytochrome c-type biogenesis CcmF C-terminal domain-containing protein [Humidesulfovibrio sp.]